MAITKPFMVGLVVSLFFLTPSMPKVVEEAGASDLPPLSGGLGYVIECVAETCSVFDRIEVVLTQGYKWYGVSPVLGETFYLWDERVELYALGDRLASVPMTFGATWEPELELVCTSGIHEPDPNALAEVCTRYVGIITSVDLYEVDLNSNNPIATLYGNGSGCIKVYPPHGGPAYVIGSSDIIISAQLGQQGQFDCHA